MEGECASAASASAIPTAPTLEIYVRSVRRAPRFAGSRPAP